jgi:hypothetical protein
MAQFVTMLSLVRNAPADADYKSMNGHTITCFWRNVFVQEIEHGKSRKGRRWAPPEIDTLSSSPVLALHPFGGYKGWWEGPLFILPHGSEGILWPSQVLSTRVGRRNFKFQSQRNFKFRIGISRIFCTDTVVLMINCAKKTFFSQACCPVDIFPNADYIPGITQLTGQKKSQLRGILQQNRISGA